jgi:hypothetical protein
MKGFELIGVKPFEIRMQKETRVYKEKEGRLVAYKEGLKPGKIVGIEEVTTSRYGRSTCVVGKFTIDDDTTPYYVLLTDVEDALKERRGRIPH